MPSLPDSARTDVAAQLAERVDAIATWISDLDARLRAAEVATGDEKTAKELRRALEALAKHDPKLEKRLTDRVDVLGDRMATLASTVSTTAAAIAKRDGEIAALRRELEDGSKRIERLVREHAGSVGAEEVEKLRATLRTVAAERPARTSDTRADELTSKVDVLAQRVDTLATTVSTTAAGLAGREGDIAGLRQKLDESSLRIEQTVAELRRQQGDHELADRLESLQSAVAATTKGLAGRGDEIAALARQDRRGLRACRLGRGRDPELDRRAVVPGRCSRGAPGRLGARARGARGRARRQDRRARRAARLAFDGRRVRARRSRRSGARGRDPERLGRRGRRPRGRRRRRASAGAV